jgi:hypothetical protein
VVQSPRHEGCGAGKWNAACLIVGVVPAMGWDNFVDLENVRSKSTHFSDISAVLRWR